MIYDVIYSLVFFIEKLAFFNKQLSGFTIYFSYLFRDWYLISLLARDVSIEVHALMTDTRNHGLKCD